MTWFWKFVFPGLWCGMLALFTLASASGDLRGDAIPALVTIGLLFVPGTFVLIWWLGPLKNVWSDRDTLVVSNFLRKTRIPASEISAIVQHWDSARTITVRFRTETDFGSSIRFQPVTLRLFGETPEVRHLRDLSRQSQGTTSG